MSKYQMPVKAIKNILQKEHEEFKKVSLQKLHEAYVNDATKELIYIASEQVMGRLNNCVSYDDLDDFLSFAGYRMSLEDWINLL